MTLYAYESLRDIVGRAIYDVDEELWAADRPDWYALHEERREPWRRDADRVLAALSQVHPDHPELVPLGIKFDADLLRGLSAGSLDRNTRPRRGSRAQSSSRNAKGQE